MSVETRFFDGLNRTPAFALALRGNLELLDAGLAEPVTMVMWDHKAVVGFVDGLPVGVITFQHTKWMKQLDIMIGYVLPTSRRAGVYRAMWAALVEHARALEAVVIFGNTATANDPMRSTAAELGRDERAVILKFDVPPAAAATAG